VKKFLIKRAFSNLLWNLLLIDAPQ